MQQGATHSRQQGAKPHCPCRWPHGVPGVCLPRESYISKELQNWVANYAPRLRHGNGTLVQWSAIEMTVRRKLFLLQEYGPSLSQSLLVNYLLVFLADNYGDGADAWHVNGWQELRTLGASKLPNLQEIEWRVAQKFKSARASSAAAPALAAAPAARARVVSELLQKEIAVAEELAEVAAPSGSAKGRDIPCLAYRCSHRASAPASLSAALAEVPDESELSASACCTCGCARRFRVRRWLRVSSHRPDSCDTYARAFVDEHPAKIPW